jgi:hypothetical protein
MPGTWVDIVIGTCGLLLFWFALYRVIRAIMSGAWVALRAYFLEPSRRHALDVWKAENNAVHPVAALGISQPKLKFRGRF